MTSPRPRRWDSRGAACLLTCAVLTSLASCAPTATCRSGDSRPCERTTDGGYTQSGNQTCEARGTWSACVPVGACRSPGGGALPVYARCSSSDACGPPDCAVCGHYASVRNPEAYGLCYPFCAIDQDCAPTTASLDVSPRCVLGQCTLLCHAGSACPNDTQCLAWSDPAAATDYPAFDGLCE